MIKEEYVSFETAKLLNGRGFPEGCQHSNYFMDEHQNQAIYKIGEDIGKNIITIPRPTQQMAVRWLREVHNIDIEISPCYFNGKKYYYWVIYKKDEDRTVSHENTYEEACEAAIKYCLREFI